MYDNKFREQENIDLNVNTVKNAGVSNIPTKEWDKVQSSQYFNNQNTGTMWYIIFYHS